jgi:pimeloyl-ACP methyl ester carboxylesterase
MSAIIIDSGLVHYEAIGRGKPIIFLHGWLGSWRYWMPTMEVASDRYRTYALDLWGFGDSDKSPNRYDLDAYVNMVSGFMDAMGIIRAPIVGHALGAVVALLLSDRQPDIVARLMTVSLPVVGAAINRKLTTGTDNVLDRMIGRKQAQTSYPDVALEADKADITAVTNSARLMGALDLRQIMESQDMPTLVVHGEKDSIVAPPQPDWLDGAEDYTNVRPLLFKDSSHFPMIEEANKFQRLLKDFLEMADLDALELKEEWRRRSH